tara:strand:- start:745 stop:1455 length:711 start_codon:yes stop_codon:yes gene_type:complete
MNKLKEDEINLFDIIKFYWNGKIIILLTISLSTIFGYFYIENQLTLYNWEIKYDLKLIPGRALYNCNFELIETSAYKTKKDCHDEISIKMLQNNTKKINYTFQKSGILFFSQHSKDLSEEVVINQINKLNEMSDEFGLYILDEAKSDQKIIDKIKNTRSLDDSLAKKLAFMSYNNFKIIDEIENKKNSPFHFYEYSFIKLHTINKLIIAMFACIGFICGTGILVIKDFLNSKNKIT